MPSVKSKTPSVSIADTAAMAEAVPQMRIRPPLGYTAIPTTNLTLFCGQGMVETSAVLVPYVDIRLMEEEDMDADADGDDESHKEAWRGTVAYENAAYVIMDMANDFRMVTRRLRQLSKGDLQPEPERLKYAALCLQTTKAFAESALDELQALIGEMARPADEASAEGKTGTRATPARKAPLKMRARSARIKPG